MALGPSNNDNYNDHGKDNDKDNESDHGKPNANGNGIDNREEKSLRHVAMIAKFSDDNKPKTSLKRRIRTASNFIDFIQFHLIWHMLVKFPGLNPKGPYLSLEEEKDNFCVVFTYSIKQACEIRKFHVAGVQRRQRNVQNSVMHVQICCFVNKNLLLFLPFSFRRRRRWFCFHPEIVLPW